MSDARPGGEPAPAIPGVADLVIIGKGGFGVVYRGHQAEFGRDVAVKVLMAPGADEKAVARWSREITAMGRLSNHPNIVAVFSAGVTPHGHPYLLMPFVGGGSLHDRLRDHGPLPGDDVVRVGSRLARGLAAAHGAGVLHRDVKPANVLMSEYGEPQLSDFGIARLVDAATTTTGSVQATIGYAAPEILSGEMASPASDVYGLGATLHAALSGRAPFAGPEHESLVGRIGRVMTQPPPDLRPLGVAPGLAEVIEAALAKDPADRPADAEVLRRHLEGADLSGAAVAPDAADAAEPTEVVGAAALGATAVLVPGPAAEPVTPSGTPPVAPATAVQPAAAGPVTDDPVPAAADRPGRASGADGDAHRGRGALIVLGLVGLFLVAGLIGWVVTRDGGDDDVGAGTTESTEATSTEPGTNAPPAESEPPAATEDTTESTPEPTDTTEGTTDTTEPEVTEPEATEPEATEPEADTEAPTEDELSTAVDDYYGIVGGGDLEAGYARLSPRYRGEQSFAGYRDFWNGIDAVAVQGRPRVDVEAMTVAVTLRYDLAAGGRSVEEVVIGFVAGDDGQLLIDTYAPA